MALETAVTAPSLSFTTRSTRFKSFYHRLKLPLVMAVNANPSTIISTDTLFLPLTLSLLAKYACKTSLGQSQRASTCQLFQGEALANYAAVRAKNVDNNRPCLQRTPSFNRRPDNYSNSCFYNWFHPSLSSSRICKSLVICQ